MNGTGFVISPQWDQ